MDIDAVCDALADAASAVTDLECFPFVPDQPSGPTFYVAELEIDFNDRTYGGDPSLDVTCRVLVPRGDNESGQRALRRYMQPAGEHSVRAALTAAAGAPGQAALGGAADDLVVRRSQNHGMFAFGVDEFFGFELIVHII